MQTKRVQRPIKPSKYVRTQWTPVQQAVRKDQFRRMRLLYLAAGVLLAIPFLFILLVIL